MRGKQRMRKSRWLVPGLLVATLGLGFAAGCSGSDDPTPDPTATGPAICQDLAEQKGLRDSVVKTILGEANTADRQTITSVAGHLNKIALETKGDLGNRLVDTAQALNLMASGSRLSDDEVMRVVVVFKALGQEVQKKCA